MPAVTVVIPVHNGAPFVADAIESALAQTGVASELIVVDDGSTDGTPEILSRFGDRIAVTRQPNRGLAAARNTGIRQSRGEFLIFLDADDLMADGDLRRFAEAGKAFPDADVFHCGWRGVDFLLHVQYANESPLPLDADPFHQLLLTGSPPISSLFVRRAIIERVGLFDKRFAPQEDWDFWLRLAACGARFQGVPGNVAIIRRRPSSMSAQAGAALAMTGLAALERQLAQHTNCPACTAAQGLASWRRSALRSSARGITRRIGVPGRPGRWLGMALAVARTPRLFSAALTEWRQRR